MPIHLKRVYEPAEPGDGFRLLTMRHWPRGVRKEHVDAWERALAPSRELLSALRENTIDWASYATGYRAEMASQPASLNAIEAVRARAADGTVTLMCWCHDENRCHRSLLRDLVLDGPEPLGAE